MNPTTTTRRGFVTATAALGLSLKYGCSSETPEQRPAQIYRGWEDLMRNKWTWDRVVRGSRGINCTGHCAFNLYVRNGIVWREEQQGDYGASGDDVPDYGPRGCQKGLRQAKQMYGKQRVLYPMKRVGERGEGRWERISWDQALTEIAGKFIDYAVTDGPTSISYAMGTAMILKRVVFGGLFRFGNITGCEIPETFAGVGDLPVGAFMTLGYPLPGDNMAAVYKSKCCLVWVCNPAATRIPDAHFFWEARYNGTDVVVISPDFNPSAMHASKWVNPKPGTDAALAMAMVQTIIADGTIDWNYVREQTDLPFLVRLDNQKFLRESDLVDAGREDGFYFWDTDKQAPVLAPGTGFKPAFGPAAEGPKESLVLGDFEPALEGQWTVASKGGDVAVTTVFELVKQNAQNYTPENVAEITGVNPSVTRNIARSFAGSGAGMIFAGYRVNKWLHGDLILRAWLLMCALTGNTGRAGGGVQTTNLPRADGLNKYAFEGLGPRLRVAALATWDYAKSKNRQLNAAIYGDEIADHIDSHYREAIDRGWMPDYGEKPWNMAIMAGHNPVSWRASGERWRETALSRVKTLVAITPDMSATAMHSDYVLPAAHHYEIQDMTMEGRTPYVHVLNAAVEPLGDSKPDWFIQKELLEKISQLAVERSIEPIQDSMFGQPIERDYTQAGELFTLNGQFKEPRDVVEFLFENTPGLPKITWEEFAEAGIVRTEDSEGVQFGPDAPFSYETLASTRAKKPYKTLTGRQQYYIDHDWFLSEGEQLPVYKDPLAIDGYELRLTMGHARHGVHSLYRDDSLLVSLQRGEPDIHVNPDDAKARDVEDGGLIRVFNSFGSFVAMAHVTASMQPKQLFMYHGWDPMMFRGHQNFNSVISTAGLLKPVQMISGYGHLNFRAPVNVPNQTHHDCTCEFEKYVGA